MSNYTVTTNFGSKDSLASGNPAKLILGAQFTTEFTNIATAISTKQDASSARTTAEIAAGVTPTNYSYFELDPRRYGAVGDGTTNDTAALNLWVSVVNASTNPVANWPTGLTYVCGPLAAITVANFTWNCFSTLLVLANSWTATQLHISITGAGCRVYGLQVNGNQANFSSGIAGYLLSWTGSDLLLDGVQLTNSCSVGLYLGGAKFRISNCHFDSNAYNGAEIDAASYGKTVNTTFNFNGYGFQKTLATNTFQAFGFALRFRTHHCVFMNCEAMQNGRDGFNTNQGSYAIKYVGCVAWMNGDGGFTIASDNTSGGTPGNSEACYDLEYVDCEAYNNWSSGLSAYALCYNVTVDGGRYYNNHRIAGTASEASSYFSGLYFSGGSTGIRVRTKSYDDRQLCPVTAATSGVVTATGWVAGTMGNYPRVAFYNAALAFQGWGNITAESAGSVTVTTTASNGVTTSSIAAGWFVTQRVQNNGCFFDNACIGSADIDGFGFMPNNLTFSGYKTMSAFTANGQNILLPEKTVDYTELLLNPTFDSSISTGWTYSLTGGGASNLFTTAGALIRSPGALQLIGGTAAATADSTLITSGLNYVQNAWVETSVWAYSVNNSDSNLILFFNPGSGLLFSFVNHPGGGWRQLKIGAYLPAGSTQCTIRLTSAIGKTNYFDNATLRVKSDYYDPRDAAYASRSLPV